MERVQSNGRDIRSHEREVATNTARERTGGRHGLSLCLAAALLAPTLAGCSRTVTWEEEVPLNTGETIWIKRSMPWALKGGFGNPFDIGMRPTREQVIRFNYGGKEYSYSGRANVLWIAISPAKQPVLVAPAADFGWYSQNNYHCVVPYYVQLVPDESGKRWTWPEQIESWLYQLPANVMSSVPSVDEKGSARFTAVDKATRDATYRTQFPAGARIDRFYKAGSCIAKFSTGEGSRSDGVKK